jgi:hypothetical protein
MTLSQHGVKASWGIKNYTPPCPLERLGVGRGGVLILLGGNKVNGELYFQEIVKFVRER